MSKTKNQDGGTKQLRPKWTAVRDEYRDRQHRREAVATWVDKRAADDLWIVDGGDGSSVLVGGEAQARLIAMAVNRENMNAPHSDAAREATALAILLTLIERGDIESTTEGMVVNEAVRLADALRSTLAKGGGQ